MAELSQVGHVLYVNEKRNPSSYGGNIYVFVHRFCADRFLRHCTSLITAQPQSFNKRWEAGHALADRLLAVVSVRISRRQI